MKGVDRETKPPVNFLGVFSHLGYNRFLEPMVCPKCSPDSPDVPNEGGDPSSFGPAHQAARQAQRVERSEQRALAKRVKELQKERDAMACEARGVFWIPKCLGEGQVTRYKKSLICFLRSLGFFYFSNHDLKPTNQDLSPWPRSGKLCPFVAVLRGPRGMHGMGCRQGTVIRWFGGEKLVLL